MCWIQTGHKWLSDFFIEKVSILPCQPLFLKIGELLNEFFIIGERFLEQNSIKNAPFIDVCSNEMFDLEIMVGDPFPQVIADQFMKSFCIQVIFIVFFLFGFIHTIQ